MFKKKIFVIIFFLLSCSLNADQKIDDDLSNFVKQTHNHTLKVLASNVSAEQKKQELAKIIASSTDLDWMGKFALGRFRRGLTNDQITNYLTAYKKFTLAFYSDIFKFYNDQEIEVDKIIPAQNNSYIVKTLVIDKIKNKKYNIDYVIHELNKHYAVIDVVTEGISLVYAQRSEFNNILSQQSVGALTEQLLKKANR